MPLYRVRQLNCIENTTRGCGYSKKNALGQRAVDKICIGPYIVHDGWDCCSPFLPTELYVEQRLYRNRRHP